VIVMKSLSLAAVQEHSVPLAVTTTLLEPPAEVKLALVEVGDTLQGAPACDTVQVWPAMVIVPIKGMVLVLGATV
jgi:hypothetical protein